MLTTLIMVFAGWPHSRLGGNEVDLGGSQGVQNKIGVGQAVIECWRSWVGHAVGRQIFAQQQALQLVKAKFVCTALKVVLAEAAQRMKVRRL